MPTLQKLSKTVFVAPSRARRHGGWHTTLSLGRGGGNDTATARAVTKPGFGDAAVPRRLCLPDMRLTDDP